jgi:zinc transporter ZupT
VSEVWPFLLIAGGAALASPVGGVVSLLVRPTSLLLSIAVGIAGGVLLGAVAFEMVPKALELCGLLTTLLALLVGVLLVWGFDLYVNRGLTADEDASQRRWVSRFHKRRKPRGNNVTCEHPAASPNGDAGYMLHPVLVCDRTWSTTHSALIDWRFSPVGTTPRWCSCGL